MFPKMDARELLLVPVHQALEHESAPKIQTKTSIDQCGSSDACISWYEPRVQRAAGQKYWALACSDALASFCC